MSQAILETNTVFHRMGVLSTSPSLLLNFMDEINVDLMTEATSQPIDLKTASVNQTIAVNRVVAFTLGTRAKMKLRFCALGATVSKEVFPSEALLQSLDSFVILWKPSDPQSDCLIQLPWASGAFLKPMVFCSPKSDMDEGNLREAAIQKWFGQRTTKALWIEKPTDFIPNALEWVLSF